MSVACRERERSVRAYGSVVVRPRPSLGEVGAVVLGFQCDERGAGRRAQRQRGAAPHHQVSSQAAARTAASEGQPQRRAGLDGWQLPADQFAPGSASLKRSSRPGRPGPALTGWICLDRRSRGI